ncbi:MAG: hypothetical protein QOE46_2401 [Acidobacteriota bacterium]|jgi:hypothetical protein|nr:hypothetical protein [Acidobacteriota bacterium]
MSHQRKTAAIVKRLLLCLALVSFGCIIVARYVGVRRQAAAAASAATLPEPAQKPPPQPPFPSANPQFIPPSSIYSGPLFVLSQDYPVQKPTTPLPAFLSSDFKADWKGYMMKVRDYCFEGNTDVDFRVEHNKTRAWYHMPWQDYGAQGREGIHGLTKEAQVQKQQLASSQTYVNGQTVAVGFFNDLGGYTIGQVWADHMNPNPSKSSKPNGFPIGTVIFKLLFVDVPPNQVTSLANPKQWQAYVDTCYRAPCNPQNPSDTSNPRELKQVSLIQMDIAVRTADPQAPTGWLFGTFQYNGALGHADGWENLIPVGLMWGNDITNRGDNHTQTSFITPPDKTDINPQLKETVINTDANELPPTHLGWNGRLNGPVDNPISSCMSCHMTAQFPSYAALSPAFLPGPPPKRGSNYWMKWFQDIDCTVPFGNYLPPNGTPETGISPLSTDFSLQLSISITNFCAVNSTAAICPQAANEATDASDKAANILGARPAKKRSLTSTRPHVVQPIVRDVPEAHPHPK